MVNLHTERSYKSKYTLCCLTSVASGVFAGQMIPADMGGSKRKVILLLLVITLGAASGLWQPQRSRADHLAAPVSTQPDYGGLHKADPAERAKTVKAIQAAGDVGAVPLLLEQLSDSDARVGLYVAQALGSLATDSALSELRTALRDPDPNVRFRAALALGERGDVLSTYALSRALRDADVLVQRTAAEALAHIGTPEAADSLVAALNSTQDSIIRNAMNALQMIGEPAVQKLAAALQSLNPSVRKNAATTLGYIGSPTALGALQAATADPDREVVAEVTWALSQIQKGR